MTVIKSLINNQKRRKFHNLFIHIHANSWKFLWILGYRPCFYTACMLFTFKCHNCDCYHNCDMLSSRIVICQNSHNCSGLLWLSVRGVSLILPTVCVTWIGSPIFGHICSCFLFYNLLIFFFPFLRATPCSQHIPFIIMQKLIMWSYQDWVKLRISAVSYSNHQKAPLWCWT